MTMRERSIYIWAVAALAIGVGLQVFFLLRGFYSIGWDEAGRTLDAYAWAKHGVGRGRVWLPFYRVCVPTGR
jgi:hypothetical protein